MPVSRKHGTFSIGIINDTARRAWKIRSIECDNPEWDYLCDRLNGQAKGSR
jgi:hypothetical protein